MDEPVATYSCARGGFAAARLTAQVPDFTNQATLALYFPSTLAESNLSHLAMAILCYRECHAPRCASNLHWRR
jgi:hypothetical protein